MYLTKAQVTQILNSNFFQTLFFSNISNYVLYQGKKNATVHTLRFNIVEGFTESKVREIVMSYLNEKFPPNSLILGSIDYDFLLRDPTSNTESYYIWRSNSNAVHFKAHDEIYFSLNNMNIANFINKSVNIDYSTLNIHFNNSKVVIEKAIALVFTFVKI
jgi:hypothetical protein